MPALYYKGVVFIYRMYTTEASFQSVFEISLNFAVKILVYNIEPIIIIILAEE